MAEGEDCRQVTFASPAGLMEVGQTVVYSEPKK
jgi:hypothetical protein